MVVIFVYGFVAVINQFYGMGMITRSIVILYLLWREMIVICGSKIGGGWHVGMKKWNIREIWNSHCHLTLLFRLVDGVIL